MGEWLDTVKVLGASFAFMTAVAGWFGYDGYTVKEKADQDIIEHSEQITNIVNHYYKEDCSK